MSVFRVGAAVPDWCELRDLEIFDVGVGETTTIARRSPQEVLLVGYGTGRFRLGGATTVLREGQFLALPEGVDEVVVSGTIRPVQVVRFGGAWGADVYGCGFFNVALDIRCQFVGDPVGYPKATSFDSHFHDYDEYWVIMEGSGTVVVGERSYFVRPGDCVAIGAGHRHDFPLVDARVKAAYLEVSAVGEGRLGHLWEHTHGPAVPHPGRGAAPPAPSPRPGAT